jgi:hypothetical protein
MTARPDPTGDRLRLVAALIAEHEAGKPYPSRGWDPKDR